MHDLVGLDESGSLNHEGFICYRETIEHLYPLEFDLVRVNMDVLPQRLADWKKFNMAFKKIALDNRSFSNEDEVLDSNLLSIPVEEIQYLAYCSGEILPHSTLKWLHFLNCKHNVVMEDVRAHFKKHNRFSGHHSVTFPCGDTENIFLKPMTGLWFSNRPRRVLREFHTLALQVQLGFSKWMRKASDLVSVLVERMVSSPLLS